MQIQAFLYVAAVIKIQANIYIAVKICNENSSTRLFFRPKVQ